MERLRIEPNLTVPLIAQIWGSDPDKYRQSAKEIAEMGFAGIDINMGCPEKGAVKRGEGGGMIGLYEKAAAAIAATKEGAGSAGQQIPVSVKTRIGKGQIITEEWAEFLLKQDIAALTIHGRTVREMSKVPAHWDEIKKVVELRDRMGLSTPIIGNGDVADRAHGLELAKQSGVDGIMIGRGVFHDLFAFSDSPTTHSPAEMIQILLRHVDLYESMNSKKSFQTLKRFFKIYISNWPGAAELRAKLMETNTPEEVREVIAAHTTTTALSS
jgi:tRNA-dihydrouridine synthase